MENGTHKCAITKIANAALERGVFVKLKSDDATKVVAASVTDTDVIGVTTDAVAANDVVGIEMLGVSNKTILAQSGTAIGAGAQVCVDANGKAQAIPAATAAAQTVTIIGRALTQTLSGAHDEFVEIAHHAPVSHTIAATNG